MAMTINFYVIEMKSTFKLIDLIQEFWHQIVQAQYMQLVHILFKVRRSLKIIMNIS